MVKLWYYQIVLYPVVKKSKFIKKQEANELDKASFQHDMTYGDFKDLAKRTASDKVLRDKANIVNGDIANKVNIAKNPEYDGY